ncbi:MAG: PAS domain S-box protein, partial [Ferruginibacter sp.]
MPPLETLKAMEAVVKQHQGVYIFQHKLSSGNIKFVEVHSTAIEDNNKTVLFSIVNDIDDKIRTENLLKEEKDNLNAILATFPDIIFKLDNENKFLYCHTNDADNLLMPTDEFLGKHITDVLPDTISLLLIEKIETAKQTGDLQEIIYSINIPNKGAVWYEARIVVFKQSGTIILARDITTKVNSNKQLMLLESAIANVADSIIITEAETINQPGPKIVFVNDAFVKNTGYTRKEVIGKTPRILQGKNSDRKELDRLRNAMEHRAPCEIEIINYKKNGEEYWVQISLVPMADENGDITNWVATQKDITDKKKIDAQLNTLSKVIEQSPASIMITDINANIEYVNTAFTNISGYTPEEVIGKNAKILKTEHTLPEQHKSLVKALKRKEIWHGEFINKSKDGKLYWGQVVISPVFNNQGELIHFVSVNENVTQ